MIKRVLAGGVVTLVLSLGLALADDKDPGRETIGDAPDAFVVAVMAEH
jgi:hypothetical protein